MDPNISGTHPLKHQNMKTVEFVNGEDPDEAAHHEPLHLDIHYFAIIPYFFSYKTEFFSLQTNPKKLDPSCKMALDVRDCLGRVKLIL